MAVKSRKGAPIHSSQIVSEAFATILKHNFAQLTEWEDTARSWDDIEGVHQMRVTLRRMRSALSTFRPAIPKEMTRTWSEQMRWLANQLGDARDLDVFIDEGLTAVAGKLALPGEERLSAIAHQHRASAYETVRAMLDGEQYARFKEEFAAWLNAEQWLSDQLPTKYRKRLEANVVPFARKLLDKRERSVLERGSHVNPDVAEEMHRLRIECKKLRYAAEFFTPLFQGMGEFIGHLKGLQDLLGVMNDVAVMEGLVAGLIADENDSGALQYAGGLVGWRTRQYHEIKSTFPERWDDFVHAKHPWWKKSAIIQ